MKDTRSGRFMIYGRSRNKFQKLFPAAIFEGYECNCHYAYFIVKNKYISRVKRILNEENIPFAI